jgi:hypothetical protein
MEEIIRSSPSRESVVVMSHRSYAASGPIGWPVGKPSFRLQNRFSKFMGVEPQVVVSGPNVASQDAVQAVDHARLGFAWLETRQMPLNGGESSTAAGRRLPGSTRAPHSHPTMLTPDERLAACADVLRSGSEGSIWVSAHVIPAADRRSVPRCRQRPVR